MKYYCYYVLVCILLVSCQKDYDKNLKPFHFIPETSDLIIKVNALNDFSISLESNPILYSLYNEDIKNVESLIRKFNFTSPIYIAFKEKSINKTEFLILSKGEIDLFASDSLSSNLREGIKNSEVTKIIIDSTDFYYIHINGVFIGSNNADYGSRLNTKDISSEFYDLIETTDNSALASVIFKSDNIKYSDLLFSEFLNDEYAIIDINQNSGNISFNGIVTNTDTLNDILSKIKYTLPQKINTSLIAPSDTKELKSLLFDDYSKLRKNFKDTTIVGTDNLKSFLTYSGEIALIDNALILHSLDTDLLIESIDDKSFKESFREIDIYSFGKPDFFKYQFKPVITFDKSSYFFAKDDFVIFSSKVEYLKKIITDYLSNKTLANSEAFQYIQENLSDESSMFIYKNLLP